jgi:hypothetical protein
MGVRLSGGDFTFVFDMGASRQRDWDVTAAFAISWATEAGFCPAANILRRLLDMNRADKRKPAPPADKTRDPLETVLGLIVLFLVLVLIYLGTSMI